MLQQKQDTKTLNTVDVMSSTGIEPGVVLPTTMPKSPLDLPVESFNQALDRREVNRKALLQWIERNLKPRIDFGQIHVVGKAGCQYAKDGRQQVCPNKYHWSKPSLWKPGAEKICGMLGIIPRFPNIDEYEKAVLRGEEIKTIILKCELHTPSGFIAAEGIGARRVDQDKGDINKSLKMAEKSAHIDSTLRLVGLSEIFTQDIEDMINDKDNKNVIQPGVNNVNHSPQPNRTGVRQINARRHDNNNYAGDKEKHEDDQNNNGDADSKRITEKQRKLILYLYLVKGVPESVIKKHCLNVFGVSLDLLSRKEAGLLINNLMNH